MNKDLIKEAYISFFFLGKAPIAPGTFGTIGGVIIAFLSVDLLGNNVSPRANIPLIYIYSDGSAEKRIFLE